MIRRSANHNGAAVRHQIAGQELDQRGFSGTVVANNGGNVAWGNFKVDLRQRTDCAEPFFNLIQFYKCVWHCVPPKDNIYHL